MMPALSLDLTGPKHPNHCQGCGADAGLVRWQEHDEHDRPTPAVVVLCARCSRRVKPHPRLYKQLQELAPWPGCMPLCVDCTFRDGTRCAHPMAKANGGTGVILTVQKPAVVHLYYGGSKGEWVNLWRQSPTACQQRRVKEETDGGHPGQEHDRRAGQDPVGGDPVGG